MPPQVDRHPNSDALNSHTPAAVLSTLLQVDRHPNADALYLEEIDLGEGQPRQVVSGLVKFVPVDKMQVGAMKLADQIEWLGLRAWSSLCRWTRCRWAQCVGPAKLAHQAEWLGFMAQPVASS